MAKMKSNLIYYFSVEGETEQWYLKCLENIINSNDKATKKVSIKCSVQKDPVQYAKRLTVLSKVEIYHLSDYESDEPIHVQEFATTMDHLKEAGKSKQINYKFGYSNLTFDLWIVLHQIDCYGPITHRKNYLSYINRGYNENFENMKEYKCEANFKRCLKKLDIYNVINAIERAKNIMRNNEANGYILHEYKGFKYYKENPSLAIWEAIEKILKDCSLL